MLLSNEVLRAAELRLKTITNPRFRDYIRQGLYDAEEGDLSTLRHAFNLKWYPVDVEEFLLSTHYMDAANYLYPAVIDELIRINTGNYNEVLFVGGIGSAKTTGALYTNSYQLYLLSCMKSPHFQYDLDPSSEIMLVFQNKTEALAKTVSYNRFRAMIEKAPYFQRHFQFNRRLESKMVFPHRIEVVPTAAGNTTVIGQNVIGGLIDELNYMEIVDDSKRSIDGGTYDQAVETYNAMARRRKSRFVNVKGLAGILCLVSSRRYPGQFTDTKEEEAKTDPTIYVYDKRVWDVKPEGTFSDERFRVFTGDLTRKPRILTELDVLPEEDHPLIVEVPSDFKHEFQTDILNALREIAGVSTLAQSPYIPNVEAIKASASGANLFLNHWCDFDQVKMQMLLSTITDLSEPRAVHLDLSRSDDSTGLAIGHMAGMKIIQRGEEKEIRPRIVIDGAIEVRPPKNGEILFWKIREAIYRLKELGLNIKWVTCDSYQSTDTLQVLRDKGYITGEISMDTSIKPYMMLKSAIYDERIVMPDHPLLVRELGALEYIPKKDKVDHPYSGGCTSKDMADAVCGVAYCLEMRRELWARHGVAPDKIPESYKQAMPSDKAA